LALVVANLQLSATDLVAPAAASVDSDSIKNVPQRYVGWLPSRVQHEPMMFVRQGGRRWREMLRHASMICSCERG
jgi:hypothetical protein